MLETLGWFYWNMLNCEQLIFPLDDKPNIKSQEDENTVDAGILMSIVLET